MEKKKMKLWKKILIGVVLILIVFVAFVARRTMILSDIDKKVTYYENNSNNIYAKTTFDYSDYKSTIQRFIKDDVEKFDLERTDLEGETIKMTQFTYPEERKTFIDTKGNKVMYTNKEKANKRGSHIENPEGTFSYTAIVNFAYSTSLINTIYNAMFTNIKSIEIDGKQCYELSSLRNSNVIYMENTTKVLMYVEKDTGLPVKMIEEVNEDGKSFQNVTTYEYSFGIVTDKDMEEPDATEYKDS